MKKFYTFEHALYPFTINIYLGFTWDEMVDKYDLDIPENTGGFVLQNGTLIHIWLDNKEASNASVYAHELYHACYFMFRECGIDDYNEAMAYNLSYMIDKYLEALKLYKKKKKK